MCDTSRCRTVCDSDDVPSMSQVLSLQHQLQKDAGKFGIRALPRSLRRRTRSHTKYRHLKRPNQKKEGQLKHVSNKLRNRRMRRVEKFRNCDNPFVEKCGREVEYARLATHVWHARRMTMASFDKYVVSSWAISWAWLQSILLSTDFF